jgi:predicted DsbA family dithiol-disulfide isomerase
VKTLSQPVEMTVFYDFGCPWVYRIAKWLNNVRQDGQYDPKVTWRAFPLEQVNAPDGPEWGLWEKESRIRSKSRSAFEAALAAKRQGQDAFERFHWALLKAKWEEDMDHGRRSTHLAVAESIGLDIAKFEKDLEDPSLLSEIGADYTEARNVHGVFGTPTVVFPNGGASYLKLTSKFPAEEATKFFDAFVAAVRDQPDVLEIKRPTPPQ